ncbi:Uncharacterised protein [Bordetella pertussis]|nr:Uncharacterised protein [Bordetella pertussis]CFU05429.1 Uncharacterised protein [Bordetella pertussis]
MICLSSSDRRAIQTKPGSQTATPAWLRVRAMARGALPGSTTKSMRSDLSATGLCIQVQAPPAASAAPSSATSTSSRK